MYKLQINLNFNTVVWEIVGRERNGNHQNQKTLLRDIGGCTDYWDHHRPLLSRYLCRFEINMENISLKLKKEAFVSGLNGTSLLEITVIANIPIVLGLIRAILILLLPVALLNNKLIRFVFEWIVVIFPLIAFMTIFADNVFLFFVTGMFTCMTTILFLPSKSDSRDVVNVNYIRQPIEKELTKEEDDLLDNEEKKERNIFEMEILSQKHLPFISAFRAYTLILSCICILAVDFNIFPRRLAKTEVFGAGLMDTGVGLFVVSNAIVSPEAREKKETLKQHSLLKIIYRVWLSVLYSWPLWTIGVIRAVSVKLIGYQEHVTEYGVHWNFFFTLATVKIVATFLLTFSHTSCSLPMGVVLALLYQYLLSSTTYDLTGLILNDNRIGFFMANKEGILSCIGYLAIYLIFVHVGRYFLQTRKTLKSGFRCCFMLVWIDFSLWCLLTISSYYIQPISRRFANLSYVIWIVALSIACCAANMFCYLYIAYAILLKKLPHASSADRWILFTENEVCNEKKSYVIPPSSDSIVTAVNRNQFVYFILSNLATGLVNYLYNTMELDATHSIIVISVYSVIILLFIWVFHVKQITLKLW